jgi:hypothetical protein
MDNAIREINVFIDKVKSTRMDGIWNFPIDRLCEVQVNVYFKITYDETCSQFHSVDCFLKIYPEIEYTPVEDSSDYPLFEVQVTLSNRDYLEKETFEEILKTLRTLTFNSYKGIFEKPDEEVDDYYDGYFSDPSFLMEYSSPTIEYDFENCAVCHTATTTKPTCGHNICLVCWSKVNVTDTIKKCPICRCALKKGI